MHDVSCRKLPSSGGVTSRWWLLILTLDFAFCLLSLFACISLLVDVSCLKLPPSGDVMSPWWLLILTSEFNICILFALIICDRIWDRGISRVFTAHPVKHLLFLILELCAVHMKLKNDSLCSKLPLFTNSITFVCIMSVAEAPTLGWRDESLMASHFNIRVRILSACMHLTPCWCLLPEASTLEWRDELLMPSISEFVCALSWFADNLYIGVRFVCVEIAGSNFAM